MPEENRETSPTSSEPFVVMAKPVGPACNLECSYCYYLDAATLFPSRERFRMSDEILENYIRQYMTTSPGPEVLFVWHGGEPTLAGLDFYRRVLELQQKYLPDGKSFRNNLQTNGILLNEEWCSFLADNHFDVGLSIDGTQWVHDTCRKDRLGYGTWELTAESIRRLKSHGIQPDLLCTVTSVSAREPLSVYRALRDFDTGWIQFIPIVQRTPDGEMTPESVSGEAYGRFMSNIFNEWIHHDLNRLNVQLFAEMSLVWMGGSPSVCWMSPTCGRVLIIEHDGGIYSCDHFVNKEHYVGNLITSPLNELVDSDVQYQFGENKQKLLPQQCRSCSWLEVCNGGCPKDRFAISEYGETGLNYLCDGLRRFYSYAEKPLKYVIRQRKAGKRPEVIMAELRDESREKWKGIGRNDPCPCGSGLKAKNCCWDLRP
ncbi:MAG TPA: anaerobic sulfatase maturase [Dehalococcoidia bacterium]|nr:anaerobic sulfatase maturase [Dehalococcoidia bacterium]